MCICIFILNSEGVFVFIKTNTPSEVNMKIQIPFYPF